MGDGKGVVFRINNNYTIDGVPLVTGDSFLIKNVFMGGSLFGDWSRYKEFGLLPWAQADHNITKREYRVARLHVFLLNLKVLRNMTEENHIEFRNTAIKRLKRARWARYQQSKKKV
jgi:hypothetical protein